MKKLFTLVALLAVFMGAKAEWVEDYAVDYSTYTSFPFFVMGYVPEWVDGVMTDYGANYRYVEKKDDAEETSDVIVLGQGKEYYRFTEGGGWHQYFIADGIPTELDGAYTVKAMVKASEAVTINVNMGWGWGDGQSKGAQVSIGTEWAEVEWDYTGIGGASCNLVAQPGGSTATIEWKWLKVSHNAKAQRPTVWQQWLTNDGNPIIPDVATESKYMGDAEFGQWPDWALETTEGVNINWRGERTGEICAWALTMGKNYQESVINDDSPRARPYPADIEAEEGNPKNHVFAIHVDQIAAIDNGDKDPDNNSIQWSNQFWIQSPKGWKEGTQVRIKFRYKAKAAAKAATQIHKQNPSNYLHYEAVGDVNFTTEWQEFDKTITFNGSQATGWSLAFNLCADSKVDAPQEPNIFYFDDLSWETMVLDEGWFVASSNASTGIEYDYDNAVECVYDADEDAYVGTVGTVGKEDTWVNEVMISTIRGNDTAFKGATIKLTETLKEEEWLGYTTATLSKIKLPAAGVWQISVAPGDGQIQFVKLEGEAAKEPVDVVTNPEVMVINTVAREDLKDSKNNEGVITVNEEKDDPDGVNVGGEGHNGQTYDNQFFIKANRALQAGEETVVEFKYVATTPAKSTTQCHGETPGAYMHYSCIPAVEFTTEEQTYTQNFTVPAQADGMWCISFDLAVMKDANTYTIKDVKWYLKNDTEGKTLENLIDATGTKNFFVKIGAGTDPYQYGTETGISNVTAKSAKTSTAIYNLAGQRVDNGFKGIVIKDGKKFVK